MSAEEVPEEGAGLVFYFLCVSCLWGVFLSECGLRTSDILL